MSIDIVRRLLVKRPRPEPGPIHIGQRMARELAAMQPGEVMRITDIEGRDFGIIALDDLQFMAERAKMVLSGDL